MNKYEADEQMWRAIKSGDRTTLNQLFERYRSPFISFLQNVFQCESKKALDIYPESFSILYFNIRNDKLLLPLKSTLQTYLLSIGKFVYQRRYYDKFNKVVKEADHLVDHASKEFVDEAIHKKERAVQLQKILDILGEPCRSLLHMFYYQEFSYEAISNRTEENENRLRKRKYDCLKKLHQLVQEHKLDV